MTCNCRRPIRGAKLWEICNGCNRPVRIGKPCKRCKTEPEPNPLQPTVDDLRVEVERLRRREQTLLQYNNEQLKQRRAAETKLEDVLSPITGLLNKILPNPPSLPKLPDYGEMEVRVLAMEEQSREQEREVIVKWLRGLAGSIRNRKPPDPDLEGRQYWYDGVADDIKNGNGTLDLLRKEQRGY